MLLVWTRPYQVKVIARIGQNKLSTILLDYTERYLLTTVINYLNLC